MLYSAIDQHRKQLTVNLRNEKGDVLVRRQVSTQWDKVREFFGDVRRRSGRGGGFMAILEVCGFNDWLVKILNEYDCKDIVLVHPTKRATKKTDYRDANALGELLWVNRKRLKEGKPVQNLKRVILPSETDAEKGLQEVLRRNPVLVAKVDRRMNDVMIRLIFLSHAAATLYMTGLIWFVQIVHYPLLGAVGNTEFSAYEQRPMSLTTWVVAPPMLIEATAAVLLFWFRPTGVPIWIPWLGVFLLAVIWLSTAFLQVPCHDTLSRGFDAEVHRRLVSTNWIRTFAWSLRGLLVLWMMWFTWKAN